MIKSEKKVYSNSSTLIQKVIPSWCILFIILILSNLKKGNTKGILWEENKYDLFLFIRNFIDHNKYDQFWLLVNLDSFYPWFTLIDH